MKKNRRSGFTLVEVSLFLAISGLLLAGIIAGTQSSIRAQRFKDSVQNYAEFLRSVYSEVGNPQSPGDGRSNYSIYGRLVTFGQSTRPDGTSIPNNEQRIYVYDVIGGGDNIGTTSVVNALSTANASVVFENKNSSGTIISVTLAGNVREYTPTWGASIDSTTNGSPYTGSILIVRHPKSGAISTLVSSRVIQVNRTVVDANNSKNFSPATKILKDNLSSFAAAEVNFCVNPNGPNFTADVRRNVRIISGARNASGVDLINQDDANNKCLK